MKKILFLLAFLGVLQLNAQLLSTNPAFVQENSTGNIVITVDISKGNAGLTNVNDVVVHTGVITSKSTTNTDWKYSKFPWPGTTITNAAAKCTPIGGTKLTFTITGGIKNFYGITDPTESVRKIAILFRNAAGTSVLRNFDGSDMFIPVYNGGLDVRIDNPLRHPLFTPQAETITKSVGEAIGITANSSLPASLRLLFNGTEIATNTNAITVAASTTIATAGNQQIIAEAINGASVSRDTINFVIAAANTVAPLPSGLKDGINYDPNDASTATLVLFAPLKQNVFVIGDFSNWEQKAQYQMNVTPDANRYWIKLTGLKPGEEYGYQFIIDGNLKVPDYNTEKVLDPWNDKYIPSVNYPNLKPYPEGKTTGIVSVLQTAKPAYNWQISNFNRPKQSNLLVYELLVRDFSTRQSYQAIIDSLPYLKRLGINCIELMPVNEFEGNNSWGYNSSFYFAPDKMYGTEYDLRRLVDACHAQGIALVLDIALNHSFGQSPMVQMYWNAAAGKPATNSPWFYPDARHPFNVGYDINHNTQASRDFVDRVIEHWLVNYKVDGFRWDLSKGFTPDNMNTADIGVWSAYSQGRIDIWKRIYDKMQAVSPKSYCILEHLGDNGEEAQMGNYGMMFWGKMTDQYNNATMGYPNSGSDLTNSFDRPFWSQRNLIAYQESHDEERLAYKNRMFGVTPINVDVNTSMKRNAAATALFGVMPGPKMIWQFGEVGYDFSINTCEDLTVGDCRTNPKPIRWDYYNVTARRNLYNVYAKLFTMRNITTLIPTFTDGTLMNGSTPTYSLAGEVKQLRMYHPNMSIVAFANFATGQRTSTIDFPANGTWYKVVGAGTAVSAATINVSGFSNTFTLASGDYAVYATKDIDQEILPVNWLSFTAGKAATGVVLKWSVASETNNHFYEIERSADGVNFAKIGTQLANSNNLNYAFTDVQPLSINYYRIKQIDNDGSFSYSTITKVATQTNRIAQWQVFPNPTQHIATLKLLTDTKKAQVTISDAMGKVHFSYQINQLKAGQQITLPIQSLSKGMYWIKVATDAGTETEKLLKN